MTIKLDFDNHFVGPKAIFDPNFIPPRILFRKKEIKSLSSILTDSITDNFRLNILYQGISGIGKKVIINKVIDDLARNNLESKNIHKLYVDCKEKNFEELTFSILNDLLNISNLKIDYESLLSSNLSHLWNMFKLICKKTDINLFFIFANVEHLKPNIFKKFLQLGKENNITSIYTLNKIFRPATTDLLSEFDLKKKLSYFNYNELFSILKQRSLLTFSHQVDDELIKYITDLICEQYVPVPGKGMEIFKDLYPLLKVDQNLRNFKLIELCQNHFDQMQINDEFSVLNYMSEEDVLHLLFLDNLSNYFISTMNYYITLNELEEVYDICCETLEYDKNISEFQSIIKDLLNIGMIRHSKMAQRGSKPHFFGTTTRTNSFFMVISPNQLKALIDTLFERY